MPIINLLVKPASSLCNMRCRYCFYEDEAPHRTQASMGIMTGTQPTGCWPRRWRRPGLPGRSM